MIPFLKETAESIINKYAGKYDKICVVLPNKRTRMFFRKYYAEILGRTSWAVKFIDLNRLISSIAECNDADELSLNFDLYEIFKKHSQLNIPDFAGFYALGEIILSDFNEIDSWLVDIDVLFKNIKNYGEFDDSFDWLSDEQKQIISEFWKNFSTEKLSSEKQALLQMLKILPEIYHEFRQKLAQTHWSYPGATLREACAKLEAGYKYHPEFETLVFVGFNALTRGEEKLFKHFKDEERAEFYWDADRYYIEDLKQEAGDFLRKNFKTLGFPENPIGNNFLTHAKQIELIGVPQNTGQAKIVSSILKKYDIEKPDSDTAIVLSDEGMLFPLMHSLPENVQKLNVTMGFPFRETSLFSLYSTIIKIKDNFYKQKKIEKSIERTHIISILKHPYISIISQKSVAEIVQEINTHGNPKISRTSLQKFEDRILALIFSDISGDNEAQSLIEQLMVLTALIFNFKENNFSLSPLEKEFFYRSYLKMKRLKEILLNKNIPAEAGLVVRLLKQIFNTLQIPFRGDAVEGMQVMGVLETRNLDFRNVVILGLNEGNFPKKSTPQSFISQNVRFAFGMPVVKYRDSVYAYFFYRILQRAERICLIYNTLGSGSSGGEASRFIKQLMYESPHKVEEISIKQEFKPGGRNKISITKDVGILEKLEKYKIIDGKSEKRLTPSSINDYLDCSLKFYFKNIARINVPSTISDELSPAEFGSILHKAIEILYGNRLKAKNKKILRAEDLEDMRINIGHAINQAFSIHFRSGEKPYVFEGYTIVIKDIIHKFITSILDFDKKQAPFQLLSIENEGNFAETIHTSFGKIALYGIIDRVMMKDDTIYIVDYKTGKPEKHIPEIGLLFKNSTKRLKEAMQMLFYAKAGKTKFGPDAKIVPWLYDVRTMNKYDFSPYFTLVEEKDRKDLDALRVNLLLNDFTKELQNTCEQIFDPEIPFTQTMVGGLCEFCDFSILCGR